MKKSIILSSIFFFIVMDALNYKIPISSISVSGKTQVPYKQVAYVHRSNDFTKVLNDYKIYKNLYKKDKILYGIETDLIFFDGNLMIAHDKLSHNKVSLELFLKNIPTEIPIFFDLKDSINDVNAMRLLKSINTKERNIIFGSLNVEIIEKLNKLNFSNICFLSWLLVPNKKNFQWIIFEYYARFFGFFGGTLKNQIKVNYVAYNWESIKKNKKITEYFHDRIIAGSVDSSIALKNIINTKYSFFTDNPDKIAKWLGHY